MTGMALRRKSTATITVTGEAGEYSNGYARLTMPNGVTVTSAGTYRVLRGQVIGCLCYGTKSANISLNGISVASGPGKVLSYEYVATEKDATITLYTLQFAGGVITKITIAET